MPNKEFISHNHIHTSDITVIGVILKLSPGFSNEVWDFYIGFLLLVPAFLWISYRTLKYYRLNETHNFSYFINVYILFNALSQQGFEQDPSYMSSRIIFIAMFLSGVVIFETFSASYTSLLSGSTATSVSVSHH